MKTRASVFAAVLWAATVYQCCASMVLLAPSNAYVRQVATAASGQQAQETFRMPMLLKRKQDKEDPANPVAAAATDPNEAAMKIKSRDLVPTDRPGVRPEIHHHRHSDDSKEDEEARDNVEPDNSENMEHEDSGTEHRSSRPTHKPSAKSKDAKDDSKSAKKAKTSDKAKSEKGSKSKDSKKTHTGLDGKEVDDENALEDMEMARKKKIQVQHVQAKRRKWRTGRPKYDYKQAIAGWKEVGPMYYYKGKYENNASRFSLSIIPVVMLLGSVI
ncbi:hypothetical protein IWW36_005060 [Coemansia brasiliensis]|uniref:Transmembrane protein n=1 Tax=Coemansia brasiliensis TaxID=2650707 RepID=A0A9W8LX18_9FUNG|nr:hypothetical protein IWW36_005060 [Coemansia brasiliensis]